MSLSCGRSYWADEYEAGAVYHYVPEDFEKLKTKRRKRCGSCQEPIDIGAYVIRFDIFKMPEHDVEINIYGEDGEIARAPVYFCERCGEIYLNLRSIGFNCVTPWEDMRELLKEYQEKYQQTKEGGE